MRLRTGNAAFDEWRTAELARLDEERRKLDEAQREFAEYSDAIRRAKDREEFERFMAERRPRPANGGPTDELEVSRFGSTVKQEIPYFYRNRGFFFLDVRRLPDGMVGLAIPTSWSV